MKLKNEIFLNGFIPALSSLMNTELPSAVAYQLAKLAKEVNTKNAIFVDMRKKLAEKYGELSADGSIYEFKDEDKKIKFLDEQKAILDIEEDYDIAPIALPEGVNIKPAELMLLEPILKF